MTEEEVSTHMSTKLWEVIFRTNFVEHEKYEEIVSYNLKTVGTFKYPNNKDYMTGFNLEST